MVERLKAAVEKARQQRMRGSGFPARESSEGAAQSKEVSPGPAPEPPVSTNAVPSAPDAWPLLVEAEPDWWRFERERIVTRTKSNPAHVAFDNLRTRLLKALGDQGWNRVAITSPTKSCGKTMVAANLAFSLARQAEVRTMLLDMDLRAPNLARRLGIRGRLSMKDFLTGEVPPEAFLLRIGNNLALGLNSEQVRDSAELVQSRRSAATLARMLAAYQPHAVIYDLPPMLIGDDVIAFLPNVDAVLLVAAAGQTRTAEIAECERMILEHSRFLGVLLNKSTEKAAASYNKEYN